MFHFHYYGSSSLLVTKEFEKYNMLNFLTDHGHVSKEDSIRALGNADILISLVDDGKNGYDDAIAGIMTTKVFDYFLTGKPILSIGPILSNINTFAKEIKYNNYFSFESHETKSILSFLCLAQLNSKKMHSDNLCLPFFEEEFKKISNIFA
jgi:hypothetical protein